MNYRICYEVKGVLAFLSHLEIVRLWQRAVLRCHLPIAWSQGFNPRPKLSLGPARGVGIEGLGEYLDMELDKDLCSAAIASRLNEILPEGIRVNEVKLLPPNAKRLEAIIDEALYKVCFTRGTPADAEEKCAAFLGADSVPFIRKSPKGEKEIDLRSFVNGIELNEAEMRLSVKTGTAGSLRVPELLTALGYWDIIQDIRIQRMGLFVTDGTKRVTP